MRINQQLGSANRSRRTSPIRYIVEHYTGGTGGARNNCLYFAGGYRGASADFFVDKDGSVWQYNGDLQGHYCWAVGDGHGRYGITNSNSVSIEYVSNGEDFTPQQIRSGAELTQMLMRQFGVPAANVVRHYDASRKQCPLPYVSASKWRTLHAQLTGGAAAPTGNGSTAPAGWPTVLEEDGWWGSATTHKLQQVFGTEADGVVSHQWPANKQAAMTGGWQWDRTGSGSPLVKAMQSWLGVGADGLWGTETTKALQAAMGTMVDGVLDGRSPCVKEMQRRLNAGTLKQSVRRPVVKSKPRGDLKPSGTEVFRIYNPNTGEHFFTTAASERDGLVKAGWRSEGMAWRTPTTGEAIYRLVNPWTGIHMFTASGTERDQLIRGGWYFEGIAAWAGPSTGKPVHRLYNPNAGQHHFTTSSTERDQLIKAGWKSEGIAFRTA